MRDNILPGGNSGRDLLGFHKRLRKAISCMRNLRTLRSTTNNLSRCNFHRELWTLLLMLDDDLPPLILAAASRVLLEDAAAAACCCRIKAFMDLI